MFGYGEKLNEYITSISTLLTTFIDEIVNLFNQLKASLEGLEFPKPGAADGE